MAQTNYQGMGLYPMQEDRPPESFRDAMSKKMGLLQLGTGERPMLYGRKEGVGLFAGGGGTEPVYSGETGQPYQVASEQPIAAPTTPEAPLGTAEWVEQEFKKKKEGYAQALKNQRLIVEKGKELGLSLDKVEAALKAKNLLKLKEPELSEPMLKILEEERKEQTKVGTEEDTAFREWIGKLNILRTKEEPNQAMIQEVENYIKTKFPKSWESYRPTPPPHIPTSIAEWSEGRRENISPTTMPAPLDRGQAMQFLQEAGGDKAKARELARQKGFTF